ncbi:MAG TPA: DNA methyltransferase, partial [Nitrososphaeraceae archaeon]|nr:DNA methyltransferase [Nitrososphaeraceae archaeon]
MKLKSENLSQAELAKIKNLYTLDWELEDADTRYYTHGYHPYSAKYIPQIPYRLVSKFTKKNELVLDNFMGSGTTLVESKLLGRNAIGIDVNPLACLISKVKTTTIQKSTLVEISKILILLKEDII